MVKTKDSMPIDTKITTGNVNASPQDAKVISPVDFSDQYYRFYRAFFNPLF